MHNSHLNKYCVPRMVLYIVNLVITTILPGWYYVLLYTDEENGAQICK